MWRFNTSTFQKTEENGSDATLGQKEAKGNSEAATIKSDDSKGSQKKKSGRNIRLASLRRRCKVNGEGLNRSDGKLSELLSGYVKCCVVCDTEM